MPNNSSSNNRLYVSIVYICRLLEFLKCQRENVIPNFHKFRMADKDLQNCVTFVKYQQNPLETEINNKKSLLNLTVCVMIYNLA